MAAKIKIDEEMLRDILTTATDTAYGGSWYWLAEYQGKITQDKEHYTIQVTLQEKGEGEFYTPAKVQTITFDHIEKAIAALVSEGRKIDLENHDAEDADVILQKAVFDTIVYG